MRILKFCIKDNRYFVYDDKTYKQKQGLPMGSPASPIIADIIMEKLLDDVLGNLTEKPRLMTKYVDDIFCIARECAIEEILTKLNSFHSNIRFTVEKECNFRLSYLDTMITRKNNSLTIDWYQKPTASGRIINFFSKHPKRTIINTANNLIRRVLTISDTEFHKKNTQKIKNILHDNNFPISLTNKLLKTYRDNNNKQKRNEEKPKIYKSITYIPEVSERFEKSKLFNNEEYTIAYKTKNNLSTIFSKTKDKITNMDKSNVIYEIKCNGINNEKCEKVYVGTTKNKLKTRISGHKSDQKVKNNFSQKTALTTHCAQTKHSPNFENIKILKTENNYKRRYMLEMLHIINVPTTKRMNFKVDTENCAQSYRYLINKGKCNN